MRNFFFRGCKKSSQLNKKEIQFQLKFTNFINNTTFHSLNEIFSCNKNLIKIDILIFYLKKTLITTDDLV